MLSTVMKKYSKYGLLSIVLISVLIYCLVDEDKPSSTERFIALPSKLADSINNCQTIAVKSVAHLNAFLEFQKLEIEGRKMYVFQRCMNDQGYIENPNWVKFAEPISQKEAEKSGVSFNEAYEKLRRKQMLLNKLPEHDPFYWIMSNRAK